MAGSCLYRETMLFQNANVRKTYYDPHYNGFEPRFGDWTAATLLRRSVAPTNLSLRRGWVLRSAACVAMSIFLLIYPRITITIMIADVILMEIFFDTSTLGCAAH